MCGEIIGIGLSQPWFDPLGWLGKIIQNQSSETIFGIGYTGNIARNIDGYAQGGFWILLHTLDLILMLFFFWIMPWIFGEKAASSRVNTKQRILACTT